MNVIAKHGLDIALGLSEKSKGKFLNDLVDLMSEAGKKTEQEFAQSLVNAINEAFATAGKKSPFDVADILNVEGLGKQIANQLINGIQDGFKAAGGKLASDLIKEQKAIEAQIKTLKEREKLLRKAHALYNDYDDFSGAYDDVKKEDKEPGKKGAKPKTFHNYTWKNRGDVQSMTNEIESAKSELKNAVGEIEAISTSIIQAGGKVKIKDIEPQLFKAIDVVFNLREMVASIADMPSELRLPLKSKIDRSIITELSSFSEDFANETDKFSIEDYFGKLFKRYGVSGDGGYETPIKISDMLSESENKLKDVQEQLKNVQKQSKVTVASLDEVGAAIAKRYQDGKEKPIAQSEINRAQKAIDGRLASNESLPSLLKQYDDALVSGDFVEQYEALLKFTHLYQDSEKKGKNVSAYTESFERLKGSIGIATESLTQFITKANEINRSKVARGGFIHQLADVTLAGVQGTGGGAGTGTVPTSDDAANAERLAAAAEKERLEKEAAARAMQEGAEAAERKAQAEREAAEVKPVVKADKDSEQIIEKILLDDSPNEKFVYLNVKTGQASDYIVGDIEGSIRKSEREALLQSAGGAQKFDATLHTHPTKTATPSDNGDIAVWVKDFEQFKRHFILTIEQLAEIDFSTLNIDQVKSINDAFNDKAGDIDEYFSDSMVSDFSNTSNEIIKQLFDYINQQLSSDIMSSLKDHGGTEDDAKNIVGLYSTKLKEYFSTVDFKQVSRGDFADALMKIAEESLSTYPAEIQKSLKYALEGSTANKFDEISGATETTFEALQQKLQVAFIETLNNLSLEASKIFKVHDVKNFDFKTFTPKQSVAISTKDDKVQQVKNEAEVHKENTAAIQQEVQAQEELNNVKANEPQIDDDEVEAIKKETGALYDKREALLDIAEQYGQNISAKDRDRYEELNQKEMDVGLTSKEEERFWELGEKIYAADEALEEFGATYDKIILKLANGKNVTILPDDAGLRKLYKFYDEGFGDSYGGIDVDDIIFERKKSQTPAIDEEDARIKQEVLEAEKQRTAELEKQAELERQEKARLEGENRLRAEALEKERLAREEAQKQAQLELAEKQRLENENRLKAELLAKQQEELHLTQEQAVANATKGVGQGEGDGFGSTSVEVNTLEAIRTKVAEITAAVNDKTVAFTAEESEVQRIVSEEVAHLDKLEEKVKAVKATLEGLMTNIKAGEADIGAGLSNIVVNINHVESEQPNKVAFDETALKNALQSIVEGMKGLPKDEHPSDSTQAPWALEETLKGQTNAKLDAINSVLDNIHAQEKAQPVADSTINNILTAVNSIDKKIVQGTKIVEKDSATSGAGKPAKKKKHDGTIVHGSAEGESNSEQKMFDYYYWLEEQMEKFKSNTQYVNALKEVYDEITPRIQAFNDKLSESGQEEPKWLTSLNERHGLHMAQIFGGEERSDSVSTEKKALEILKEEYRLKNEIFNLEQKGVAEDDLASLKQRLGIYESIRNTIEQGMSDEELTRYAAQATLIQGKGESKLAIAGIKAQNNNKAEAETIKELLVLYEQLGRAQTRENIASNTTEQSVARDETVAIQSLIDEKLKLININDELQDQFYNAALTGVEKELVKPIQDLEKEYEKLGRLRAQADMAPSGEWSDYLREQISIQESLVEQTGNRLSVSAAQQENFALEADKAYYAERQKLEDKAIKERDAANRKGYQDSIKDELKAREQAQKNAEKLAKKQALVGKAGNAVNKAENTWLNALSLDGDLPKDFQISLEEYYNKLDNLRILQDKVRNSEIVDPKDKDDLRDQTIEVNKLTEGMNALIAQYQEFSGDNVLDLGASTLAPGADLKERKKYLTDLAKSYFDGKVSIQGFDDATGELTATVQERGSRAITTYSLAVTDLDGRVKAAAKSTKQAETFFEASMRKLKEISSYISAMSVFSFIGRQLKQGIQYVKEIDSAMTELRKVTEATDKAYTKFMKNASKSAAKVGATMQQVISSAADFARVGYTMQEALQLSETAQILMNTSEYTDIASASDALISALKAFGYEANQALDVVDIFNTIGENYCRCA